MLRYHIRIYISIHNKYQNTEITFQLMIIEIIRITDTIDPEFEFVIKKGKKVDANSTQCSQAVTHPSTNRAQHCLPSVIGRELVCSM